jgi:hypothetical protein
MMLVISLTIGFLSKFTRVYTSTRLVLKILFINNINKIAYVIVISTVVFGFAFG